MSFLLEYKLTILYYTVTTVSILYHTLTMILEDEDDDIITFFLAPILSVILHLMIIGYVVILVDIFCLVSGRRHLSPRLQKLFPY